VRESLKSWRQCELGLTRGESGQGSDGSTRVYTVDDEDIRSLGLVNDRLMMDYTPGCRCGVQVDR
jgi:hypothetical protein